MARRKVILVTDGDSVAKAALEAVARQIGGRCISRSAGNPTPRTGTELVELIKKAACDPVLVMFDDCGDVWEGAGERALRVVANHPDVEVLGVIAVASNCNRDRGTPVDVALDRYGHPVVHAVDKYGRVHPEMPPHIFGDTVGVLRELDVPVVVGIGDLGKMGNNDLPERGAPVTRKAVELILAYHERGRGGVRKMNATDPL